ncbi:MAG: DUF4401 domain-containing protein [Candidatus Contendobacter sp.]
MAGDAVSAATPSVRAVFAALEHEGRVAANWPERVTVALAAEADAPPWYVRMLVGFGAWLASLLLIAFVVISVTHSGSAMIGVGVVMMIAALGVRFASGHDFVAQAALAVSLAGQALLAFGLGKYGPSTALWAVIGCQAALALAFPDRIHRFLSVLAAVSAAVVLLYYLKLQASIHVLVLALAAGFLGLQAREGFFIARGLAQRVRPLAFGLLVAMLGCVMLSTVYVLPELLTWRGDFSFYPRPWVSSLGFGVLLGLLEWRLVNTILRDAPVATRASFVGASALIVAASLPAPGIAASLVVLLAGFIHAERIVVGIGIGFFAVFLAAYFYGIEASLLAKSATLTATGLVVLALRHYLMPRLAPQPGEKDA